MIFDPGTLRGLYSSRLFNNEQRSGVLKASLAMDLGDSARSPPIVGRSDRLSKQNEIKSMPASSAVVNSAVDLQSDPLRRLSRSKPKAPRTGNKLDSDLAKPSGVSKRQRKYILRNRTKVHGKGWCHSRTILVFYEQRNVELQHHLVF